MSPGCPAAMACAGRCWRRSSSQCLRPAWPVGSAAGSVMAAGMFLTTLSFLVTTPGWEPSLGGFPAVSAMPGQFVLKDVVLLGVALWTAGEAWAARPARRVEPAAECYVRMRVEDDAL